MATSDKLVRPVEAKTADYTITPGDFGKVFTNRGATAAVNFTLPAVTGQATGVEIWFYAIADFSITVTGTTVDNIVTFNDVAADSVALSTASEIIGGCISAFCDGTSWLLVNHVQEVQTTSVAT